MQERKQRQREKRKEKRQLIQHLKAQNCGSCTPIGKYMEIDCSFIDFALNETKRELRNGDISTERAVLISQAVSIGQKIHREGR